MQPASPVQQEPAIAAALRLLLPATAKLSQGWIADSAGQPLLAAEAAAVAQAVPARRAEFAAGRHHARLALQAAGFAAADAAVAMPPGQGRAPRWPVGSRGSISHDAAWCAVAVAHAHSCAGLGIDIELLARFEAALEPAMATATERALWPTEPLARRVHQARVFSAKEACFKAHFPSTGAWLDFTDAEVTLPAAASGSFSLRLLQAAGHYPKGHVFQGGSAWAAERVCAVVFLPA
jgi:4'-phosphopantetheinyl transferase EntD